MSHNSMEMPSYESTPNIGNEPASFIEAPKPTTYSVDFSLAKEAVARAYGSANPHDISPTNSNERPPISVADAIIIGQKLVQTREDYTTAS